MSSMAIHSLKRSHEEMGGPSSDLPPSELWTLPIPMEDDVLSPPLLSPAAAPDLMSPSVLLPAAAMSPVHTSHMEDSYTIAFLESMVSEVGHCAVSSDDVIDYLTRDRSRPNTPPSQEVTSCSHGQTPELSTSTSHHPSMPTATNTTHVSHGCSGWGCDRQSPSQSCAPPSRAPSPVAPTGTHDSEVPVAYYPLPSSQPLESDPGEVPYRPLPPFHQPPTNRLLPMPVPLAHATVAPECTAQLPKATATPLYHGAQASSLPMPTAQPLPLASSTRMQPHSEPMPIGGGCGRNLASRSAWSVEEDALVVRSVREHGCRWRQIAALLPGRSDDAIRNRWKRVRYLPEHNGGVDVRPAEHETKHASSPAAAADDAEEDKMLPERVSWSAAEDTMIISSTRELGHRWQRISARLPGRTEHAIRNRFARLQSLASRGKSVIVSSGHGVPIGIQLVPPDPADQTCAAPLATSRGTNTIGAGLEQDPHHRRSSACVSEWHASTPEPLVPVHSSQLSVPGLVVGSELP